MRRPRSVLSLGVCLALALPATASAIVHFPSRFTRFLASHDVTVGVYTGDVDGDGWPDVLTRDGTSGNFSLLLGAPGGDLKPFGTLTLESSPTAVSLTRVDGDNRADLVIASYATSTVTLRSGLASGGFGPPRTIASPSHPNAIACGDLDGDGRTDLVVATYTETKVRVYLQQADGSFSLSATMVAPPFPVSAVVADLDGNGTLDIAVAGSTALRTYYGAGDGTYPLFNAFSYGATKVVSGDFNQDGVTDLAVDGDNAITVLLGNGSGGYGPISFLSGATPSLQAVGDGNGDGYDDLVIWDRGAGQVRLYLGAAQPAFASYSVVPGLGWTSVAVAAAADFDGDGKLDIVTAGDRVGQAVAHGNGDGTWGEAPDAAVPTYGPNPQIEFGDMNGDGHPDLAALSGGYVDAYAISPDGLPSRLSISWVGGIHLQLRDMNNDGKADLEVLQSRSYANPWGAVQVWLAQTDGTFAGQPSQLTATDNPFTIATAPVNADASSDVVVAEQGSISTYFGVGNGALEARSNPQSADFPLRLVLADLNGDSHPEAIVEDDNHIVIYPGMVGTYFEPGVIEIQGPATLAGVSDMDGDGKPDILVWDATNLRFELYPGDGTGTLGSAIPFTGSTSSSAIFADLDGDGVVDLIDHDDSARQLRVLQGHEGFVFGPQEEDFGLDAGGVPYVLDLNGDGAPDIVMAGGEQLRFLLQKTEFVAANPRLPGRVALAASPNPARGPVSFAYAMPRAGQVELGIYDLRGRLVRHLLSGTKNAGSYREAWDGKNSSGVAVPAGVYFARGAFGGHPALAKLVVMN
ncbi:MAG TPA: FG-GAP-like repeat-containing protein [Candidatus Eisenbacteria bacterium]|nr:FG-GAP-like repeat-containing protein [Candidatus Eisenbacteria bacterium]